MQIHAPVRPDDLVDSHITAPREWTQEIIAADRIKLQNVEAHDWGYKLRLNWSERFGKWWFDREVRKLFSLYAARLDRYDTHLLIGRPPGSKSSVNQHAAVCPWIAIAKAAEDLRANHIGAEFWDSQPDKETVLPTYVADITAALELPEAPLNTCELPAVSRLKWGVLLRLSPENIERVLDYLAIEKPLDCSVPLTVNLGANCFAVCAFGSSAKEAVRIGLCRNWHVDLALKDLGQWLRSTASAKAKKELAMRSTS